MGVRDRLRNKLKSALAGSKAPAESPTASGPVDATARAPVDDAPSQQETRVAPKPQQDSPSSPSPKSPPLPDRDPDPAPAADPDPVQYVQNSLSVLNSEESIRPDAPVRNAHLRPSFSTSEGSYSVRIMDERVGLDETFPCEPDEFILEAADRAGIELPYSCRSGGCLVCTGMLLDGETEMGEQFVLEENHLARGFRLLCCTTVQSHAVFIAHQEEAID